MCTLLKKVLKMSVPYIMKIYKHIASIPIYTCYNHTHTHTHTRDKRNYILQENVYYIISFHFLVLTIQFKSQLLGILLYFSHLKNSCT